MTSYNDNTGNAIDIKTLSQIIGADIPAGDDRLIAAVRAAYWAGQEQMRGRIVRDLKTRVMQRQGGRYHHVEDKCIVDILDNHSWDHAGHCLRSRPLMDDSAEMLGWTFHAAEKCA